MKSLFNVKTYSAQEQETIIVSLLEKASNTYYNLGEYFILSESSDLTVLKDFLHFSSSETIKEVEFTDALFDKVYNKAKRTWPNNPFFKTVGAESTEFTYGEDIKFKNPMGSLNELKEGDLEKWLKPNLVYVITSKLDGSSVKLIYNKGLLTQVLSRGDGYSGKDITRHFTQSTHIKGVPFKIETDKDYLEIRGELICPKKYIPSMLEDLKQTTGKTYKNGRNTIAGLLNTKEPSLVLAKWASFIAYEVVGSELTVSKQGSFLVQQDFLIPPFWLETPGYNIKEQQLIEEVKNIKNDKGLYEYDGLVIKENEPNFEFETNSINPKGARKFKLGAENNTAETVIQDILWKVHKDGQYIPRARIKPVELVGVTVQYVSLNNYNFLTSNKLGVGAKVLVRRSGDVIPQIIKTIEPSENYKLPENWVFDEPNKDGIVVHIKVDGVSEDAEFQKIVSFCRKLDIKQAGEANLKLLQVKNIEELLSLKEEDFLIKIGKNGLKLYDSLKNTLDTCSLPVFYGAVGACGRGIGQRILEPIFEAFGDLVFEEEKLLTCEGVSHDTAEQIIENKDLFLKWQRIVLTHLIGFKAPKAVKPISNKFEKYVVVFTGIRDDDMENTISINGGKIKTSVTSDTTLVVAKDVNSNSGKAKKAREKGIKVISYEEALKIFAE